MVYLNNAATTFPKPECVIKATNDSLIRIPEEQYRSVHMEEEPVTIRCKKRLGRLLGITNYNRIYFTSGATEAFNLVVNGLLLQSGHVITTSTEHNAVLRPLFNIMNESDISIVSCNKLGRVLPEDIEKKITEKTRAIFINHCSNVTGTIQDIKAIGQIAKRHHLIYIVDASQSAGCITIDAEASFIDILVFTAHKNLFGISGLGGFYVNEKIPLKPTKYGGTGRNSNRLKLDIENWEFEVGTQNLPGICALDESLNYLLDTGMDTIFSKQCDLINYISNHMRKLKNIMLYEPDSILRGPIISFNVKGMSPADIGYILYHSYGIIVRTGLHCAPLMHQNLNSYPEGTVRVSISYLTTKDDVDLLIKAMTEINGSI